MIKKAFTLVELIVVVTILSILSTIWFVSYSGYIKGVRDSNRTSQIAGISNGLTLYAARQALPIPDNAIQITIDGTTDTTVAYQGYAWQSVLSIIEYSKKWIDPQDKTFFTYYLTSNKKYHQMMAFLEKTENLQVFQNLFPQSYAADLTKRYPTMAGQKLGILTDTTNTPIQDLVFSDDVLNLSSNTQSFQAHLSDEVAMSGTWRTLINGPLSAMVWKQKRSCKDILESVRLSDWVDGVYWINPTWNQVLQVYCDMTQDEWGWILAANIRKYSQWDHSDSWAVNIEQSHVSPFSYTTQKLSDDTINSIRSQSTYTGNTGYKLSCYADNVTRLMYCNSQCVFNSSDSISSTCTQCSGWYNGTLTELWAHSNHTGLWYGSDPSTYSYGILYGRINKGQRGCSHGWSNQGDGLLWIK